MKNTTINIIEKRREDFINNLLDDLLCGTDITAHTNATLLAIAEGEVVRLEGEFRTWNQITGRDGNITVEGHNKAINNQIVHWREIVAYLNK